MKTYTIVIQFEASDDSAASNMLDETLFAFEEANITEFTTFGPAVNNQE